MREGGEKKFGFLERASREAEKLQMAMMETRCGHLGARATQSGSSSLAARAGRAKLVDCAAPP